MAIETWQQLIWRFANSPEFIENIENIENLSAFKKYIQFFKFNFICSNHSNVVNQNNTVRAKVSESKELDIYQFIEKVQEISKPALSESCSAQGQLNNFFLISQWINLQVYPNRRMFIKLTKNRKFEILQPQNLIAHLRRYLVYLVNLSLISLKTKVF